MPLYTPRKSPLVRPTRRQILTAGGVAAATGLLGPRVARADVSPRDRKFIFVFACGGWDPTRVFADGFDNPLVDMEPGASRERVSGLPYISHPQRPEVDLFFERYASRTALAQGLLIPSIAHEACFVLSLTGRPSDAGSDWPSILGMASLDRYLAPTLVMGGPSFPGKHRAAVVQTGGFGQLAELLSGRYTLWDGEKPGVPLSVPSRQVLDAFVADRGRAFAAGAGGARQQEVAAAFNMASRQAEGLKAQSHEIDFAQIQDLGDAFRVAVDALGGGLSRCVMVCEPVSGERGFDSHTVNDDLQNVLFGDLFTHLLTLMFLLETVPGEVAPTLLDETCVVVFSEMGRTPWLNSAGGKDHWPYTSAMLVGSGVRGGAVVGTYGDEWTGDTIDPDTGEPAEGGITLTCDAFGATLLAMGDVDWTPYTAEVGPVPALMLDPV